MPARHIPARGSCGGGEAGMETDAAEARWQALVEEIMSGMRDWRTAHPHASFRELEAAVNERLDRVRAHLLEAAALASPAAELRDAAGARKACPQCGQPLTSRGTHAR